jgi:hypothetical protein
LERKTKNEDSRLRSASSISTLDGPVSLENRLVKDAVPFFAQSSFDCAARSHGRLCSHAPWISTLTRLSASDPPSNQNCSSPSSPSSFAGNPRMEKPCRGPETLRSLHQGFEVSALFCFSPVMAQEQNAWKLATIHAHDIEGYLGVYWKSPELLVVVDSEQFNGWQQLQCYHRS